MIFGSIHIFTKKTLILFLTLFVNHKNLFAFIWKMQIFQEKWIIFALEYLVGTTYMSMLENIFAISSKMEAEDKTSKIATKVWEDCILDQAYGKRKITSNWLDFTNYFWFLVKSNKVNFHNDYLFGWLDVKYWITMWKSNSFLLHSWWWFWWNFAIFTA